MASTAIAYLYGPLDGETWPDSEPFPEMAVLVGTNIQHASGLPLLARYLPAHREINPGDEGYMPGCFSTRTALLFDGWYINAPGDQYGPRTGGIKL